MNNDLLIQEFHDACIEQNEYFDDFGFKRKFRREWILEAYQTSDVYDRTKHVNGLFWSLIFGNFEMAYFMIQENYFDPTELFCDEIHILHILATMGGRDNSVKNPQEPFYCLFNNFTKESDNNKFVPTCIQIGMPLDMPLETIIYNKKKLLNFANKLVKNYDINVSVLTNWKWWLLEENSINNNCNITTQASIWYKVYRNCIFYLKHNLNIYYNCEKLTPFHLACLFGTKEFLEFLVLNGCDIFCLNCKKMCENCPLNIISFYEAKTEFELNVLLDACFSIYYYADEEKPDDISIEIYNITDYLHDEVIYILMNEQRMVNKYTLKMMIIEKLSEIILQGKYIENIHMIPRTLKTDIKFFIHINYHKPRKIVYQSQLYKK